MKQILITGATGNVGEALIAYIFQYMKNATVYAGVRSEESARKQFSRATGLQYRLFNFEDRTTWSDALHEIDSVFLLRPPHISNVKKTFAPLIQMFVKKEIKHIVFLSVQGAEKSSLIPHHKIEKLIVQSGIGYTFIRPSYFMQNLTTTLFHDIQKRDKIFVPAGNALFNWVDVENVAEICAYVIVNSEQFINNAIDVTGDANITFTEVTKSINMICRSSIVYESPSLLQFFIRKKNEGMSVSQILVLAMLHYIARHVDEPKISSAYFDITGQQTTSILDFIEREKLKFIPLGVN